MYHLLLKEKLDNSISGAEDILLMVAIFLTLIEIFTNHFVT